VKRRECAAGGGCVGAHAEAARRAVGMLGPVAADRKVSDKVCCWVSSGWRSKSAHQWAANQGAVVRGPEAWREGGSCRILARLVAALRVSMLLLARLVVH